MVHNIEENKKLYKYLERGKGHLRHQWFSVPVPQHILTDGMVRGIPVAVTWFESQKTFDGKKPFGFLKSSISYLFRPKVTYAEKTVKLKTETFNTAVTAVRSDLYIPD